MVEHSNIPQGKFKRGGTVGLAAVKVGLKKTGHARKRPFLSKEKRELADRYTDEQVAKIIFDALCVLRGTALKAAQLISMEVEFIPEVYRQELIKTCSQVPAMNRALIRKIVRTQLGPPEKLFRSFSAQPFAAASLGQVHAATSHQGDRLAVKIQYPDMAAGVKSDIRMLKGLLTPTKYHRIFKESLDEISRKVSEELDYRKEAENTTRFRALLDPGRFVVPAVVERFSTESVLTTTRVEGLHLDEWLDTDPPKSEKDHFGQLLVDLFNESIYERGLIHSDPNPGNFLFREDGKLGVIDFGCVTKLSPEFSAALLRLTARGRIFDPETIIEHHKILGVHYRSSSSRESLHRFLQNWFGWLEELYKEERFDFSKCDAYFQRGTALAKDLYVHVDHYEGPFAYFGRTQHGLMRMLQQLGARVRMAPS